MPGRFLAGSTGGVCTCNWCHVHRHTKQAHHKLISHGANRNEGSFPDEVAQKRCPVTRSCRPSGQVTVLYMNTLKKPAYLGVLGTILRAFAISPGPRIPEKECNVTKKKTTDTN